MKSIYGLIVVLAALQFERAYGAGLLRTCAYYESNEVAYSHEEAVLDSDEANYDYPGIIPTITANDLSSDNTITCQRNEDFCYSAWTLDEKQNITIKKQGCWSGSDTQSECDNTDCVSDYNPSGKKIYLFCCCMSNLCNSRITWRLSTKEPATDDTTPDPEDDRLTAWDLIMNPIFWLGITIICLLILTLTLLILLRRSEENPPKPEVAPLATAGPGYSSNMKNVDNLKLVSLMGQGKYGTVWKGMLNEHSVAVKIFPGHNKQYYLNERDIYNVPLMDHSALLAYFGCDERRTIDDRIEYMLVLSLAPLGCLQDFLVDHSTSFSEFCHMATSIAQGLSHLHSAIRKGDQMKPSICHRDLNTRNILVKADLTCCICDLGFALKCYGPRYEYCGELALAETRGILEVGTLRYMAPEVLEGAVNLKDCESALKQIDVYSLGLVIWELATRCHDFYINGQEQVPKYSPPYEAEVGKHPSYEQIQIAVSRQKLRPSFSSIWGCGTASKVVKETCEDCWDADPEARLTSLCAEERLKDLCPANRFNSKQNGDPKIIIADSIDFMDRADCRTDEIQSMARSTSKGSVTKPNKKDKFPFKLFGKKLKRHKIEKTFQVRTMMQKKLFKRMRLDNDDCASSIGSASPAPTPPPTRTNAKRPTNLDIVPQRYCFPPNRSTAKVRIEAQQEKEKEKEKENQKTSNRTRNNATRESAKLDKKIVSSRLSLQPVPDITIPAPRIVVSKSAATIRQMEIGPEMGLKRQRSLEVFREVFGTRQSTERLRDPSQRVKTPGDVPPSVRRKTRACKTLSLYDDRMMGWDTGHSM